MEDAAKRGAKRSSVRHRFIMNNKGKKYDARDLIIGIANTKDGVGQELDEEIFKHIPITNAELNSKLANLRYERMWRNAAGQADEDIAKELNLTPDVLVHGLRERKQGRQKSPKTDLVRKLSEEGKTPKYISENTGIPLNSVHILKARLRKQGVKLPRMKPGPWDEKLLPFLLAGGGALGASALFAPQGEKA